MLELSHLAVRLGGTLVLDDFSLSVPDGHTVAVTGPSGIGKSTMLRAVCGLVRVESGAVLVDGVDVTRVPTHSRSIVLMSQEGDLFPSMSVFQNVEFGVRMRGVPRRARTTRVREVLQLVGLLGFEDRDVSTLSGGQARRIALARALAPSPSILLLDEPLTGLDRTTHDDLARDLSRVLHESGITCVVVTHDVEEARTVADSTVSMG